MRQNKRRRVAVIGGGASGMMAAGTALDAGAEVTVFEHRERFGRKLYITGKGRCNLTNYCAPDEFLSNVTKNPRFLYTAIYTFPPERTMELFESLGVKLKVERGRRVFPLSDRAADVVDAMARYVSRARVVHAHVDSISEGEGGAWSVIAAGRQYDFDAVVIAGGGRSYPLTGSDGSCYDIAESLGHSVTPLVPSLVPIEAKDAKLCASMQGLSLKNVNLTVMLRGGKTVYSELGEMLFTHFGISGPLVLSASAHMRDEPIDKYDAVIDMKPALDEKKLNDRILSDFEKYSNRDFENALRDLLPCGMIPAMVAACGVDPHKKVNAVTREERRRLISCMKAFRIPLERFRPISEAIVTSGGIDVKEINPKTMESKIAPSIYFAGEIIDVDAYTGGYNLQIAFATGYVAGKNSACAAAQKENSHNDKNCN